MPFLTSRKFRQEETYEIYRSALMLVSVCLGLASLSSASWGSFISIGKATGFGNPSWAPIVTGHVACAVRSGTSAVIVNEFKTGPRGEPGRTSPAR